MINNFSEYSLDGLIFTCPTYHVIVTKTDPLLDRYWKQSSRESFWSIQHTPMTTYTARLLRFYRPDAASDRYVAKEVIISPYPTSPLRAKWPRNSSLFPIGFLFLIESNVKCPLLHIMLYLHDNHQARL